MLALLLPLGDDWYGLEMTAVREVVAAPPATALPNAPATVLGVFNLRGEIVPLFDTAMLLGVAPVGPLVFAAVVETALGPAALSMSAAAESASLGDQVGASELPGALAVHALGARLVTLLDVEALLVPARAGAGGGEP